MSNYYKVWIKSESYYWMKVKTADNISEENVRSNFREFDSECFDPDDVGTWDLDSVEEIDEDEFNETESYNCNWEEEIKWER